MESVRQPGETFLAADKLARDEPRGGRLAAPCGGSEGRQRSRWSGVGARSDAWGPKGGAGSRRAGETAAETDGAVTYRAPVDREVEERL